MDDPVSRFALLLQETTEDADERALLSERQTLESSGRGRHAVDQEGAKPRPGRREVQDLHPTIRLRGSATHEAARLEAIYEAGDVGRVAGERVCQLAHGKWAVWLDQVQDVTLSGGEIEVRRQGREVRALLKKEAHEQPPSLALGRALGLHSG